MPLRLWRRQPWWSRVADRCNILISSAGRRVGLIEAFRSSLDRLEVAGSIVASDMSTLAPARHVADSAVTVPPASSEEFVPTLLEICERERVSLVIPTIDPELTALARAKAAFASLGTTVAISDPETIAVSADKNRTHEWLTGHGFPTVKQTRLADFEAEDGGQPFPIVVKPARGSASVGVRVIESPAELGWLSGEDYVVQSRAPGSEYTTDVYVDGAGRVRATVPRERLEVRAGEVSKGRTVRHAALEELVANIAASLPGAYGALNVQAFVSDDEINVIEINPRFGGGFPLAHRAGADMPGWLICERLGRPIHVGDWQSALVMIRYDDAVYVTASDVEL